MPWYLRNLLARGGYMEPQSDDTGAGGGSGGSDDDAGKGGASDDASGKGADDAGGAGKGASGDDGKGSKLSDKEAELLRDVMNKKTKLKEVSEELANFKRKYEGIDPDAVRALLKEKQDAETKKLEEKGEWDRLRSQMNEQHQSELTAREQRLADAMKENESLKSVIADLTVGNSFAMSEFVKSDMTLPPNKVRAFFGQHFEFKDGAVIAYDKPAGASERTMLVDAQGEPLAFELALRKLVDADPDRNHWLKSKMKPGAGSSTDGKGAPTKVTEQPRGAASIANALAAGFGKK